MKIISGLILFLIVASAGYALGYYGMMLSWRFVNWATIDVIAIFTGIVTAIQCIGVLANARHDYGDSE